MIGGNILRQILRGAEGRRQRTAGYICELLHWGTFAVRNTKNLWGIEGRRN